MVGRACATVAHYVGAVPEAWGRLPAAPVPASPRLDLAGGVPAHSHIVRIRSIYEPMHGSVEDDRPKRQVANIALRRSGCCVFFLFMPRECQVTGTRGRVWCGLAGVHCGPAPTWHQTTHVASRHKLIGSAFFYSAIRIERGRQRAGWVDARRAPLNATCSISGVGCFRVQPAVGRLIKSPAAIKSGIVAPPASSLALFFFAR